MKYLLCSTEVPLDIYTHGLLKRLLLTDCMANKILYIPIANLRILWCLHLYWRLLNEKKLSCTNSLIKVLLITVIFQSQVMTSFFRYFGCLWVSLRVSFYLCTYWNAHHITTKLWSHRNTRSVILNIDLTNDVDVSLHFDAIPWCICVSS